MDASSPEDAHASPEPDPSAPWLSAVDDGPATPWLSAATDDDVDPEATEAQLAALDKFLAAGRADLEAHIAATVDVEAGLRAILGDQP